MELFFAVNNQKPVIRGSSSYIDVVEVKDVNRPQRIQRILHKYRITATAGWVFIA